MFEKTEQRAEWLKKGMDPVDMEQIYLQSNGIRVIKNNFIPSL